VDDVVSASTAWARSAGVGGAVKDLGMKWLSGRVGR
jgi:hypothetical protein